MNKIILLALVYLPLLALSQSYAPAAGKPGTTAIKADSSIFVAWATGGDVVRGLMQIDKPELGYADFGDITNTFGNSGVTSGRVVSLGDGGIATLTFDTPITNGPGNDFAVFENGMSEFFLELAFVEVSSDGERFVRFPAYSETQTDTQVGGFGSVDCRYIHNLAGKYKIGFGTPFDLEDIKDSSNININKITHVRVIDVIGTIQPEFGSKDALGRMVNDPFPTPFNTSGFDLTGVGVIHEFNDLNTNNVAFDVNIYPNPVRDLLNVELAENATYSVMDLNGRIIESGRENGRFQVNTTEWDSGVYFLEIVSNGQKVNKKIVKL